MPIPCVDTIVHKDNKVLLGYRTILPYRNVWALIGGRMHYGESFNDTAIRNCRQSGLTIEQLQYVGVFPIMFRKGRHDLSFCIAARHVSGQPKPTLELSRYTWVAKRDLKRIHPVGGNYLKMIGKWWCSQQSPTQTQHVSRLHQSNHEDPGRSRRKV